jgi:hypothetical protein
VNPFVTAGCIPDFLRVNRFGSQLFSLHEALSGRMETSVAVFLDPNGFASRGDRCEAFAAARILQVVTMASSRLQLNLWHQLFEEMTINVCMAVATESLGRKHKDFTPDSMLLELVVILTEIKETWQEEFPDWAGVARHRVRIRLWPVCEDFYLLVSPDDFWYADAIRWERLPAQVANMPYSANKRLAQQWLSSAMVHSVAEWDQMLAGLDRARILLRLAGLPGLKIG